VIEMSLNEKKIEKNKMGMLHNIIIKSI